jgi:hypothetical protein
VVVVVEVVVVVVAVVVVVCTHIGILVYNIWCTAYCMYIVVYYACSSA